LIRPLVSVHRLVLLLPDMYHLLDPSVHSVAFSVDDFGLIPIYDVVDARLLSSDTVQVAGQKPVLSWVTVRHWLLVQPNLQWACRLVSNQALLPYLLKGASINTQFIK